MRGCCQALFHGILLVFFCNVKLLFAIPHRKPGFESRLYSDVKTSIGRCGLLTALRREQYDLLLTRGQPYPPAGVRSANSRMAHGVEFARSTNSIDESPGMPTPSIGQTPTCGCSLICVCRCMFYPGTHARSRRRILSPRRKNAEFAATAQPSGHISPVAARGRKFETG
jgi:hypothetical protein